VPEGFVAARDTDGLLLVASPEGGLVELPSGRIVHALSWEEVDEVLSRFDRLDPFAEGQPFWTTMRDTDDEPLWGVVWGAKRYVLLLFAPGARCRVATSTEHVLGAFAPPPGLLGRNAEGKHRWTEDVARTHAIVVFVDGGNGVIPDFSWESMNEGFPAVLRVSLSGPDVLAQMPPAMGLRPFARVVEAEVLQTGDTRRDPRPVAPDPGDDLGGWRELPWYDARSSQPISVTTDPTEIDSVVLETLRSKSVEWVRPREPRGSFGVIVDPLLLRDVGRAGGAFSDGSPQTLWSDVNGAAVLMRAAIALGAPRTAELAGLAESTARFIAAGRSPSIATVRQALAGLTRRLGPDPLPRLLDLIEKRTCAYPRCDAAPRRRSQTCSERHRKALARLKEGTTRD